MGDSMETYFPCLATAAFGLEGIVADELRNLHMNHVSAENGAVRFSASIENIFLCNLSLRCCDRIFIILAEKKCFTFEELFQLVSSVPWERFVSGREAFNVSAHCARSRLMSPRDCQSITKKAILERLKTHAGKRFFPEDGSPFPVQISVHSDIIRVLLNTSGEALSRRGYRTWNGEAPLRETLAAALVRLSPWKPGMPFCDPCCGTGTIPAEAALIAAGRLPGLNRRFAMEQFSFCSHLDCFSLRQKASSRDCTCDVSNIYASDIDQNAVTLAARHFHQADLDRIVSLSVRPLQALSLDLPSGVFICNPPYGERLSDTASARALYHDLRCLQDRHPSWSLCAISSDPAFEKAYGKRANKKRRLYNGRLECVYYIFYGRKPESF